MTLQEEGGCTLEVLGEDDSVLLRLHVQGVPPDDFGRGVTISYQATFADWRFGEGGRITAHTIVNAGDTPVALEGLVTQPP